MANLLAMIQNVSDRIGIPRPTLLVGSNDPQARTLLAMAQQEGVECARRHNWQSLINEATFSTVASTEGYTLPTAFDRFVEGSMYDRTQTRPMVGPLTPQRWQQMKATLSAGVWHAFRVRGNQILIMPTPTSVATIAYEYVSKYWCGASTDTTPTQALWTADTDIGFVDDELTRLGIAWRFLRARGLDYSEAFRLYEDQLSGRISQDGGMRTLDLSGASIDAGYGDPYAQDGSWSIA